MGRDGIAVGGAVQGSSYRYRRFFRFVSWRLDRVSLPWLAAGERNTVSVGDALLGGSFRLGSSAVRIKQMPPATGWGHGFHRGKSAQAGGLDAAPELPAKAESGSGTQDGQGSWGLIVHVSSNI